MNPSRRVLRVLLSFLVILPSISAHAFAQTGFSNLLVGYTFDEAAGTVTDVSGSGNHGTVGGASWMPTGRYGAALSFDGVNDRVIGPRIALGPQFTLMAWVNGSAWSPYETLISVGRDRDLFVRSGTVSVFANEREVAFGTPMTVNAWHHVAITSDGTTLRAYVDAALVGSATMTLVAFSGDLHVGAWYSGSAMSDFWSGSIDDVRIYSRALSLAEVQTAQTTPLSAGGVTDTTAPLRSNGQPSGQLASTIATTELSLTTDEAAMCRYSTSAGTPYASMVSTLAALGGTSHSVTVSGLTPGGTYSFFVRCQDAADNANTTDFTIAFSVASQSTSADLLVVYPMDEGSGELVRDGSGRGNDAVRSGASWTSSGRFGGALVFDGINDVVTGPSLTLGGAFTFMGWLYQTPSTGYRTVLTVGSNRDLYLRDGVIGFYTGSRELSFGQALPTLTWQHVAITYDGAAMRAYLNGTATGSAVSVSLGATSGTIRVGAWSTSADFLHGMLDEVRVYTRALSPGEVAAEVNSSTVLTQVPDTTPPAVTLTSPLGGTVVSGVVSLSATASDVRGVVGVQFLLDGQPFGAEDTASPYTAVWDATTAAPGSHTIQATARDAAGNRSTATASVTVGSPVAPTPGYALRFTGSGSNVNRVNIRLDAPARPIDVGAGDFTLEWWMKIEPGAVRSQSCRAGLDGWIWGDILLDRDVYWAGDHGDFGVSLSADGLAFGVARGTTGTGICGRGNLATGAWRHVAVTRRASDGRLQIYVDGRLDTTGFGPTGNVSYRDGRATQYPGSDPLFVIGAEKHNVVAPQFTGMIDELRVSTNIRYSADFTRPNLPFVSDSDTAALYHFDEGQGKVVGDSSEAPGGPSTGTALVGGSPAGPAWVTDTPFN